MKLNTKKRRTVNRRKPHTAVFSSKPQEQPEGKDFGPGNLQLLDEEATQERLRGESEAI